MAETETIFKSREASHRNLKVQVGQIVNLLSSNTEKDPEEQEETIIFNQHREIFEDAEVDEEDEESIVHDLKWLINY